MKIHLEAWHLVDMVIHHTEDYLLFAIGRSTWSLRGNALQNVKLISTHAQLYYALIT